MKNRVVIASSTLVAGAIAIALILRPSTSIVPAAQLAAPQRIPPAVRSVIRSKMQRHGEQLSALMSRAMVLDYDGAARVAGEIYDEPALARPVVGDELNAALPERFFVLQDGLRAQARLMVDAAARRDNGHLAESVAALAKSCVACHEVYLHGTSN